MTVTKEPDHRGEHEISRKTIARGMPDVSGVTVVTNARATYQYTRGCGRTRRPAFPAPSILGGYRINASLGRFAPRECESMSFVIARSEATKQSIVRHALRHGLLRGACHRARVRATRWLAMTGRPPLRQNHAPNSRSATTPDARKMLRLCVLCGTTGKVEPWLQSFQFCLN